MKFFTFLIFLTFFTQAQANEIFDMSSKAISVNTWISTDISRLYDERGVSEIEQMRDEMPALFLDIKAGLVVEINDVKQLALRELMQDMAADIELMAGLHELNPGKSDLEILSVLLAQELE